MNQLLAPLAALLFLADAHYNTASELQRGIGRDEARPSGFRLNSDVRISKHSACKESEIRVSKLLHLRLLAPQR